MIHLPTLNASLNGLATVFLILGWFAIRSKNEVRHRWFMSAALTASVLFLIFYLYYHFSGAGITHYEKGGFLRTLYFSILFTHTPLAVIVPPAAITALWHALHKNYSKHTRITRWLLPVWLYVSVTGVIIYFMLYIF